MIEYIDHYWYIPANKYDGIAFWNATITAHTGMRSMKSVSKFHLVTL